MKRWRNPHLVLDWFLMERCATPFAHYMDYRWHINRFKLALGFLQFGLAAQVAGNVAIMTIRFHYIQIIGLGFAFLCCFINLSWLRILSNASRICERDPDQIPREAIGWILFPPISRGSIALITLMVVCMVFTSAVMAHSVGLGVQCLYLPSYCACLYLAGTWPSGRERRKKKERRPWTALFPRLAANPT